MNICVIGAGAIGGWAAARLALAGEPVMAVTSRGPVEQITLIEKGVAETAKLTRFDGPVDLLIIAVKATALEAVAPSARNLIGARTTILPMLNGVPWWFVENMRIAAVDPSGAIGAALPIAQVVGCVVHASCSRDSSGRIAVNHSDKLIIGEPRGGFGERIEMLFQLLSRAGLKPEPSDNVRRAIWYKLWGNATTNPLSALTRATCDRILASPACRTWMREGMEELAAIGATIGCPIAESADDRMKITARLGAFKTSMLQDVEAGRPLEIEALLGAPLEIARAKGIATPALDRLYGATRLLAESLD